jgi:RNA polymerase sigma factor (sigma-70 family)
MTRQDEFHQLIAACRERDPAATAELVRRYLPHIQAAVRRKLDDVMRARFDSLDFAQDVWISFFRVALDRLVLQNENDLIAFLSQMAKFKVFEEYRHQTNQKNGLLRTLPGVKMDYLIGQSPTPSAELAADEKWHRIMADLPEREQTMLRMLRDGHSHAEIAAEFNLSTKTVQRLVRRLFGPDELPSSDS